MTDGSVDRAILDTISTWLAEQSLIPAELPQLHGSLCQHICAVGIPLRRATVTWPVLHPMFRASRLQWEGNAESHRENITASDEDPDPDWLASPMYALLHGESPVLRRRLSGPGAVIDFGQLEDLAAEGYTDYFALKTYFEMPRVGEGTTGFLTSWATDREGGFTDSEIQALIHLQQGFAIAFRSIVMTQISQTLAEVYLGPTAGAQVLRGAIREGDGQLIEAVVYYADLRGSTALSERLPNGDYLQILSRFFSCAGGAVLNHGGEILDFVGDSVVAMFPITSDPAAAELAARNAANEAFARRAALFAAEGDLPLDFGVGLSAGSIMFGNIGTEARLVFTAIGPVVNEAARLEKLTKELDARVLASAQIAALSPDHWYGMGEHQLDRLLEPVPVFGLLFDADGQTSATPRPARIGAGAG